LRRYGPLILGLALFAWTGLQWSERTRAPWTLKSVDHKNMVWTNRQGEVLLVTASGEQLSGYRVVPGEETVTFQDVSITYERLGNPPLRPEAGTGNLFDDLE
jgi:hypothetical protein